MVVLIPAYEPDQRLVDIVAELRRKAPGWRVVIVDDGSSTRYAPVFTMAAALGATVLVHPRNRGKGAALKSGFAWIRDHLHPQTVVCADSDGQHLVVDIVRVASAVRSGTMALGGRTFTGAVPVRSRLGNSITRHVFRALTGVPVYDTQTGLRAYPPELLDWLLTVPGERFEYEFQALLRARTAGIRIVEVEITTVYETESRSSHFRTVRDSVRVYAPLLGHAWMMRP